MTPPTMSTMCWQEQPRLRLAEEWMHHVRSSLESAQPTHQWGPNTSNHQRRSDCCAARDSAPAHRDRFLNDPDKDIRRAPAATQAQTSDSHFGNTKRADAGEAVAR